MSTEPIVDSRASGEQTKLILIVENDPGNREILDMTLRAARYSCVAANTLEEAWSRVQQGDICLVITDLHIGARDDDEALTLMQWMRATPLTAHIPVIVASGERRRERIAATLAAGAIAYLTKPYKNTELLASVRQCLTDGQA